MKRAGIRFLSFLLVVTIAFTSSYSYAYPTLFKTTSHAQRHVKDDNTDKALNILENPSSVSIPSRIGRIVEHFKGKEDSLIIHIQDRHADKTAQFNIAKIIDEFATKYDTNLMCLEGASKELDTSFYDKFTDGETKEKVSEFFVEKALFTGAEYYKITNKEKYLKAFGAEDRDTYLQHLAAYKDNVVDKDRILKFLKAVGVSIDMLKNKIYTKALKEVDKKSNNYAQKQIQLPEYLKTLETHSKKVKLDTSKYKNLNKFVQLIEQEQRIDFKEAESQREALIKKLSESLDKEKLDSLLQNSLQFRLGKITQEEFYDYLKSLIEQESLKKANYKNLLAYCNYLAFSKTINHLAVFDEAEDLEEELMLYLCQTQAQKDLVLYSKSTKLLYDLYSLKLVRRQLNYLDNQPQYSDIYSIQQFLSKSCNQYGLDLSPVITLFKTDQESINSSKRYYKLALKRDIALVDNTLKRMQRNRKHRALLITGGFHTSGITNILKEKDISYIVICPTIGGEDCEKAYSDRMAAKPPSIGELAEFFKYMLVAPLITAGMSQPEMTEKVQAAFAALCGISKEIYDQKTTGSSWQAFTSEEEAAILSSINKALENKKELPLEAIQEIIHQYVMDQRMRNFTDMDTTSYRDMLDKAISQLENEYGAQGKLVAQELMKLRSEGKIYTVEGLPEGIDGHAGGQGIYIKNTNVTVDNIIHEALAYCFEINHNAIIKIQNTKTIHESLNINPVPQRMPSAMRDLTQNAPQAQDILFNPALLISVMSRKVLIPETAYSTIEGFVEDLGTTFYSSYFRSSFKMKVLFALTLHAYIGTEESAKRAAEIIESDESLETMGLHITPELMVYYQQIREENIDRFREIRQEVIRLCTKADKRSILIEALNLLKEDVYALAEKTERGPQAKRYSRTVKGVIEALQNSDYYDATNIVFSLHESAVNSGDKGLRFNLRMACGLIEGLEDQPQEVQDKRFRDVVEILTRIHAQQNNQASIADKSVDKSRAGEGVLEQEDRKQPESVIEQLIDAYWRDLGSDSLRNNMRQVLGKFSALPPEFLERIFKTYFDNEFIADYNQELVQQRSDHGISEASIDTVMQDFIFKYLQIATAIETGNRGDIDPKDVLKIRRYFYRIYGNFNNEASNNQQLSPDKIFVGEENLKSAQSEDMVIQRVFKHYAPDRSDWRVFVVSIYKGKKFIFYRSASHKLWRRIEAVEAGRLLKPVAENALDLSKDLNDRFNQLLRDDLLEVFELKTDDRGCSAELVKEGVFDVESLAAEGIAMGRYDRFNQAGRDLLHPQQINFDIADKWFTSNLDKLRGIKTASSGELEAKKTSSAGEQLRVVLENLGVDDFYKEEVFSIIQKASNQIETTNLFLELFNSIAKSRMGAHRASQFLPDIFTAYTEHGDEGKIFISLSKELADAGVVSIPYFKKIIKNLSEELDFQEATSSLIALMDNLTSAGVYGNQLGQILKDVADFGDIKDRVEYYMPLPKKLQEGGLSAEEIGEAVRICAGQALLNTDIEEFGNLYLYFIGVLKKAKVSYEKNAVALVILADSCTGQKIPQDLLLSVATFISGDGNAEAFFERALLAGTAISVLHFSRDAFNYMVNFIDQRVERDKRLAAVRSISSIISNNTMKVEDTLTDWKIFFDEYVKDFGFLANRDLVLIHRYLFQEEPLDSDELAKYSLDTLGITSTGREGIKKLKEVIHSTLKTIIEKRDIDGNHLQNPIIKAIVGAITGFYTAQWGHGLNHGHDLHEFVKSFHEDQTIINSLSEVLSREGSFEVNKIGKVDFTEDEINMFMRHQRLIKRAAEIVRDQGRATATESIKDQVVEIIESQIRILNDKLPDVSNANAQENIRAQIRKLNNAINTLSDVNELVGLLTALMDSIDVAVRKDSELQDIVILTLLIETFYQYPQLKDDMITHVSHGISLLSISNIAELRNIFVKEHVLSNVSDSQRKAILRIFRVKIFEQAFGRVKKVSETAKIGAFMTKGILGEMAGDIGDACYTAQNTIMQYPTMVGAVIFTKGSEIERELVGSMLVLENSINGEKVWILRAINPSEALLSEYSAPDFLKGALEYIKDLAKKEGVRYIVAPIKVGSTSNRDQVTKAIEDITGEEGFTELDNSEAFNGPEHELKDICKVLVDIAQSSTGSKQATLPKTSSAGLALNHMTDLKGLCAQYLNTLLVNPYRDMHFGQTPNAYGLIIYDSTLKGDEKEMIETIASLKGSRGSKFEIVVIPSEDGRNLIKDWKISGNISFTEHSNAIKTAKILSKDTPVGVIAGVETDPEAMVIEINAGKRGGDQVFITSQVPASIEKDGKTIESFIAFEVIFADIMSKFKTYDDKKKYSVAELAVILPAVTSAEFIQTIEALKHTMDELAKAA